MLKQLYFFHPEPTHDNWMLSAFTATPVLINGIEYQTTEHYFQAAKYFLTDPDYAEVIKSAKTPLMASMKGRNWAKPMRPGWESCFLREHYALVAQIAKYTQHEEYKQFLLETENADLCNDTIGDTYWGVGKWRNGENHFGRTIRRVREAFKENKIEKLFDTVKANITYAIHEEREIIRRSGYPIKLCAIDIPSLVFSNQ